ncbi:CHAP domain-containing protein [Planomonospora sp. ID67723]|uniref:CHAP domain-containing protein n=1 Tax=Planomonospora sp. ID67723 TaxID=2738134 RepID=UPI0018C3A14E|nr:CHAP domain-containing protein [Planomonospora sp. ID67723]MBG0828703.1 CHAP domain-containing protein [Planomonospora sp. ID67723]
MFEPNIPPAKAENRSRFFRRFGAGLTATAFLGAGAVAGGGTPAMAAGVSRAAIVSVAQGQLANGSRNHEQPMGSGCNYYTGYFRTWKPAGGCPSSDGVQWRNSDWCADFVKYVWKNAGVPHAEVPEGSGGVLTGWASSFRDYGTRHGTWHTRASGYTPQPGDAVVFDWNNNGEIDHVGMVKSADGSTVHTIEGNSGDRIREKSYSRGDGDIVGYSAPVGAGSGSPDLGVLNFHLSDSQTSNVETRPVINYGNSPMIPIRGDWDGDGKDTVSAYDPRSGRFYISNNPASGQHEYAFMYGNPNAVPLVGDWDGDGKDNVGVRMGITFYLRTSPVTSGTETTQSVAYGDGPMIPAVGDWDGDGKDTVSAYDPRSGRFYISNNPASGQHEYAFMYGNPNAVPLVGDWDGDGKDNVGVRMGNTFYLRTSPVTTGTETTHAVAYGDGTDLPITGDWDGDGKASQGVVR